MGSLDVDPPFINIALEETIEICSNELFKESETVKVKLSLKSFCLWLLRIHILFLMGHFINKSMVWLWVLPRPYISYCLFGLPREKLAWTLSTGI